MEIGFTGTREGMSSAQIHQVKGFLRKYIPEKFHHGCCVGADTQANYEAYGISTIVFHPPTDTEYMSDLRDFPGEWRKPKPYLDRNRDIVDESDLLIAAPLTNEAEKLNLNARGGTMYTVRYALTQNKPVLLIWRRSGKVLEL